MIDRAEVQGTRPFRRCARKVWSASRAHPITDSLPGNMGRNVGKIHHGRLDCDLKKIFHQRMELGVKERKRNERNHHPEGQPPYFVIFVKLS